MIAVDTNLLVYAHRQDTSWHAGAAAGVRSLAESPAPWAIPWPCVHEFLAIVTHPRIFDPPSEMSAALDQMAAWMESPSLILMSEGAGYQAHLEEIISSSRSLGPRVHDARVAALCAYHGVDELWSADRDFSRFPGLKVRNPLVG
jgi:toxin-antitoxin system PIN domain toxin